MSLGRARSPGPRALVSPRCLTLSLPLPPDCAPGLAGFRGSAGRMGVGGMWPAYPLGAPSARLCPERNKAVCVHPGRPEASNTNCPAPSRASPVPGAHLKCRQWDPPGQQAWAGWRDVLEQLLPFWPQEPGRHSGFLAWCTQPAWWEGMTLASVSLCLERRGRGVSGDHEGLVRGSPLSATCMGYGLRGKGRSLGLAGLSLKREQPRHPCSAVLDWFLSLPCKPKDDELHHPISDSKRASAVY